MKCSPQIRKHTLKDNDGFVYVRLSRYKSYDDFFAPQCYHCYNFNHFAGYLLDKDMSVTCCNIKKFILNVIYKPPHGKFSFFLQEFESLVLENEINEADVIYLGHFNICVDDILNNYAQNSLRVLNNFTLVMT